MSQNEHKTSFKGNLLTGQARGSIKNCYLVIEYVVPNGDDYDGDNDHDHSLAFFAHYHDHDEVIMMRYKELAN